MEVSVDLQELKKVQLVQPEYFKPNSTFEGLCYQMWMRFHHFFPARGFHDIRHMPGVDELDCLTGYVVISQKSLGNCFYLPELSIVLLNANLRS